MSTILNPSRFGGYIINQSIRFNDDDLAYMYRTPVSAGNRKTWTFSCWAKRGNLAGANQRIFDVSTTGTEIRTIRFQSLDNLDIGEYDGTSWLWEVQPARVYRDPSAWYHIVVAIDTTQATSSERVKIYTNGIQETIFNTATYPSLNLDTSFNNTVAHNIARDALAGTGKYFDGYLAELHFIDGAALTASDFGKFDYYGNWVPKRFTGADTVNPIAQSSGTAIGDMTFGGGLAASFDGDATELAAVSSQAPAGSVSTGHIGKDYGSGVTKVVQAVDVISPTDQGFDSNWGSSCMISVWGSNVASPTYNTDTDWTLLNSDTFTTATLTQDKKYYSFANTTAYRHYKIKGVTGSTGDAGNKFQTSQVIFYEAGSGYGTNGFYIDGANAGDLGLNAADSSRQVVTNSSIGLWDGDTSDWTFAGSDLDQITADQVIYLANEIAGDFEIQFTLATALKCVWGLWTTATDYLNDGLGYLDITTDHNPSWHHGGAVNQIGENNSQTAGGAWTIPDGTVVKITRVGSTFKVHGDGVLKHTWAQTSSANVRFGFSGHTADPNITGFSITETKTPNSFFTSGLTTADQMLDSPTDKAANGIGNRATLNLLDNIRDGIATLSNGNLDYSYGGTSNAEVGGTIAIPYDTTDLWAIEFTNVGTSPNSTAVGFISAGTIGDAGILSGTNEFTTFDTGVWVNGVSQGTITFDATIRLEYNGSTKQVEIFTGGVSRLTVSWTPLSDFIFYVGRAGGTATCSVNTVIADMLGTVTAGTKEFATHDLPAPVIKDASAYFQAKTYTGNGTAIGSGGNAITFDGNSNLSPDLVWIKDRNAISGHILADTVRGATKDIRSHNTGTENTDTEMLASFDANGFTVGSNANVNTSLDSHVAWNWNKGPVPGFDIVADASVTSSKTISHSLGAVPDFMVAFDRSVANQHPVWHSAIHATSGNGNRLNLDDNSADTSGTFGFAGATTTGFTVGSHVAWASSFVFYLFAEVDGFSKFGKYTGNGSVDGPFVYCGFRPAFVLQKYTGIENWNMHDNTRPGYNPIGGTLSPDVPDVEYTAAPHDSAIELLSNGFKITSVNGRWNTSGGTYIYMAFAETPFGGKTVSQARAR